MIGVTLIIILLVIAGIWTLFELRRFKHKLVAIFLIAIVLFTYFGFVAALKGQNIDYKTMPGIIKASKLYFSWMASVFGNFKTLTTSAVKMDWKDGNETIVK